MPISIRSLLENLEYQEPVLGVLLIGMGLVFFLIGARVFKVLVVLSFACVGYRLGSLLPLESLWTVLAGIAAGAGLAVASRYFHENRRCRPGRRLVLVFITAIADSLGADSEIALAAGGLACLVAFALAFVMYFEVIAAVMSFEGTLLIVSGTVVLLSRYSEMWQRLRAMLTDTAAVAGFPASGRYRHRLLHAACRTAEETGRHVRVICPADAIRGHRFSTFSRFLHPYDANLPGSRKRHLLKPPSPPAAEDSVPACNRKPSSAHYSCVGPGVGSCGERWEL